MKATCWTSLLAACLLPLAAAGSEAGRTNVTARVPEWLAKQLPQPRPEAGYVTSAACVGCHADEHASWHRSYHRTMTQPATPDTVLGRFDGTTREDEEGNLRFCDEKGSFDGTIREDQD